MSCPPGASDAASFVGVIRRPDDLRAADGRFLERGVVCFDSMGRPRINVLVSEPVVPAAPPD